MKKNIFKRSFFRRITSLMVVFLMVFGMMPWQEISYAADDTPTVRITYEFENPSAFKPISKIIVINDSNLGKIEKGDKEAYAFVPNKGKYEPIDITDMGGIIQAEIDLNWDIDSIRVIDKKDGDVLEYKNMSSAKNLEVSSVVTSQVDAKGPIVLNGKNLGKLVNGSTDINVIVGGKDQTITTDTNLDGTPINDDEAKIIPNGEAFAQTQILQDIVLTIKTNDLSMGVTGADFDPRDKYNLEISNVYKDAVEIVGVIALDGISMFPASGEPNDEISFTRNPLQEHDVYFVKDVSNKSNFDNAHKGIFSNYGKDEKGNSVLKIKVPKLPEGPGNYKVVLTNKNSLSEGIKSRYVLKNEEFTYIEAKETPEITHFTPKEAAEKTNEEVTITGSYITNLKLQGYTWDEKVVKYEVYTPPTENTNGALVVDYGTHAFSSGQYVGNANVTREIRVYIGGQTAFIADKNNKKPGDTIPIVENFVVKTPEVNVDPDNNKFKIKIAIDTKIKMIDGEKAEKVLEMHKEIYSDDYFTFIPNTDMPQVKEMIPSVIPIEKNESDDNYHISPNFTQRNPKLMEVNIFGDKFLVTRNSDNKIVYPKVKIGDIEIDLNDLNDTDNSIVNSFEILNGETDVDGTKNNEIGNRIKIVLKTSKISDIEHIGKQPVSISNPWRNQDDKFDPYIHFDQIVDFKEIGINDFPTISDISPRQIAVDSNDLVTVIGNNFHDGLKVFIDGKEVTGVKVSGDNQKITFNAPNGREGETQIVVVNPNDALASYPLWYIKTYSQPKFDSLNPDMGTTNTTVTATGENFKDKDPTVDASDYKNLDETMIYRLMGTRIFMDEDIAKDINKYNRDDGAIKLEPFTQDKFKNIRENIIVKETSDEDEPITVGKDFRSTILLDETNKKFYAIREQNKQIKIEDGLGTEYLIMFKNGDIIAKKEGVEYSVIQDEKGILKFDTDIELKAYTPYEVDQDEDGFDTIVGNRVFFIDSSKLIFNVPFLGTANKVCDVKIVNPDTKSVEKKDAFKYFASSRTKPVVTKFDPVSGSVDGGSIVTFTGPDDLDTNTRFVDYITKKTRVFIGNQEVPAEDVYVSADGKELTIKVPKYNKQIKEDWEIEPIVLVNPDGGSFNITINDPIVIDGNRVTGYTYVRPQSNPEIESIIPIPGNAVNIKGKDFRDFEPYSDENGNGEKEADEKETIDIVKGDYYEKFYLDGILQDGTVNDSLKNGRYDIEEKIVGGERKKSKYDETRTYIDSPLLPKVYFGTKQAEIIGFASDEIQVIVPEGEGSVDVYIVNNDTGISNTIKYTYEKTNISISKVYPDIGNKKGGDIIEIIGDGFDPKVKVRFGNITNRHLATDDINAGVITPGSTVRVMLEEPLRTYRAEYNTQSKQLVLYIEEGESVYTYTENNYDGSIKYIDTLNFENEKGKYTKQELIKVGVYIDEQKINRFLLEAGYAPEVIPDKENPKKSLKVKTPNYNTIGVVDLIAVNPDGSEAKAQFEYKNPDSKPTIIAVTRDGQNPEETTDENNKPIKLVHVNYKGGSTINIKGTDFRENATISIGSIKNIPYSEITSNLPNELTFKMPAMDESVVGQKYPVVVQNEDGGMARSDDLEPPIYIVFTKGETSPQIDKITPDTGTSKGGTTVTIHGSDFRDKMDGFEDKKLIVYFGDEPVEDVKYIDHTTIIIEKIPPHAPGTIEVKVENPDGELSNTVEFTYSSNPKITGVVDPTSNKSISEIYIDGEQEIKIKGSDFMNGARVIFAPVLEEVSGDNTSGEIITIDGKKYILKEGIEGSEVKFIDSQNMTVKTPQGKLGSKGVIIINPDKAASNIFDIVYVISKVDAPTNVYADILYEKYIKITWNKVDGATSYEVYVIEDDKAPYLIGTTDLTSFVYRDLEPKTGYRFIVKALGEYGLSKGSEKSNEVTTGRNVGPEDKDGELSDNTSTTKSGNTANIVIGTKDYDDKDIIIDLTKGSLAGSKEVVVSMPAKVVSSYLAKDVIIYGSDFYIKFNPTSFNVSKMSENRNKDDAGVKFKVALNNQNDSSSLSSEYIVTANAFVGQDSTEIDYLKSKIEISLDFDSAKADLRRMRNISLRRYDPYNNEWIYIKQRMDDYSTSINSKVDRLGRYSVVGKRR
ncbi:IPT/TIG domain-containing protein [Tepidibacter sp. Z1-5]|uniref:IPT/TIG domain-containing protein n=1 Tax=Tepidibacter sp. Z1-5 TaxID=3134138 RepID=UPI0030BBFAC6